MPLIEWDDRFDLEIDFVNEQHKKLISLLNDLYAGLESGENAQLINRILDELLDYTDYHFSAEENYFDKFNFSGAEEHKKLHRGFVNNITSFRQKFKEGSHSLSLELIEFLIQWLTNHIMETDSAYVPCFHKHGIN